FFMIVEYDRRHPAAIDTLVVVEDCFAKQTDNFRVSCCTWFDQLMRNAVSFNHRNAFFAQHRGHRTLAAGDSSGQSVAQHEKFKRTSLRAAIFLQPRFCFHPSAAVSPLSPYCSSAW